MPVFRTRRLLRTSVSRRFFIGAQIKVAGHTRYSDDGDFLILETLRMLQHFSKFGAKQITSDTD